MSIQRSILAFLVGFSFLSVASAQGAQPLPAGASKQAALGQKLYEQNCASCHGVNGRDAVTFPRPIWGPGQDIKKFGHARGLFEYLQMLMPFDDPNKINDAEKTAVAAYMLVRNGNLPPANELPLGGSLSVKIE